MNDYTDEQIDELNRQKLADDPFGVTSQWFVAAGQQPETPKFDAQQVCFYLGMQLEELTEKLALFGDLGDTAILTEHMAAMSQIFKKADARTVARVDDAARRRPVLWLDADCDSLWVTLGAIRALGVEPSAAYGLVADANWAKFPGGVVTRDENGKVVKPEGWREADLTPVLPAELRGNAA